MLNLEQAVRELGKFGYMYDNNVVYGHTKVKIKWILPLPGGNNIIKYKDITTFLFGFSYKGINFFPIEVHRDWYLSDNYFIPWDEVTSFKMKNGVLENEMVLSTSEAKIVMKINKVVARNPWVKENVNYLKERNYFYRQ